MDRDIPAELREIVGEQLLPDAPIGVALLGIADALDAHAAVARGLAAVVERVERLEREVLPREADIP